MSPASPWRPRGLSPPAEWKPSARGLLALFRRGFGLAGLRRRLLGGLLRSLLRRRVADARLHLEDPRVAAGPALEPRPDVFEQLLDERVVPKRDPGPAAAWQRVDLAERDERLDHAAQFLRFR